MRITTWNINSLRLRIGLVERLVAALNPDVLCLQEIKSPDALVPHEALAALPGGPIWIHRGAIEAAQNESQLAGVVAHEIAHIANRHAAEQITKGTVANVGLGILGAVLGGGTGSHIAQLGANVAAQATMMKFSRDDEREADLKGLQYMRRAGYDPRGMVEFLRVLRAQQGRNPGSVATFFSSHPAPAERISRLQQQASRLAGGRRDSATFQQVKRRLR